MEARRERLMRSPQKMLGPLTSERAKEVFVPRRTSVRLRLLALVNVLDPQICVPPDLLANVRRRKEMELDSSPSRTGRVQRDQYLHHPVVRARLRHDLQ